MITELPTAHPAITGVQLHLSTGSPPNQITVDKDLGTTLDLWVDVLTSADTQWQTGTWLGIIRFVNPVGPSGYSLPAKTVAVPSITTPPLPPPPPPPPPPLGTHVWTFDSYTGCGPGREKIEECSNGHARHTRRLNASEPYIWGPWINVGSPTFVYGPWGDVGSPQLISGSCKQRKERSYTRSQRQRSRNQCGGYKYQTNESQGTEFDYYTVTETWGNWSNTGATHYDDIEDVAYYEQERFSSPCNRRETRWVVA